MLPKLSLVLGGASSGKSSFAERIVVETGRPRIYIATAQAFDDEMAQKIDAHRAARGPDWLTLEAPSDVGDALASAGLPDVVLVDCATMWLSNRFLAGGNLDDEIPQFVVQCHACSAPVVVVSNEVGQGVVPDNAAARQFRGLQGALNAQLAAASDLAVFVTAGLPQVLKGALPEGGS